jgi:hypothetical protein
VVPPPTCRACSPLSLSDLSGTDRVPTALRVQAQSQKGVDGLIGSRVPLGDEERLRLKRVAAERLRDVQLGSRNPLEGVPMKLLVGPMVTFEEALEKMRTELLARHTMDGAHARATGSRVRCLVPPSLLPGFARPVLTPLCVHQDPPEEPNVIGTEAISAATEWNPRKSAFVCGLHQGPKWARRGSSRALSCVGSGPDGRAHREHVLQGRTDDDLRPSAVRQRHKRAG